MNTQAMSTGYTATFVVTLKTTGNQRHHINVSTEMPKTESFIDFEASTTNQSWVNISPTDTHYSSLLQDNLALSMVMVIGYTMCAVPGFFGNLLVIFSILTNKTLRSVANMFIVNLAVADLCITGIVEPFSLMPVVFNDNFYLERPSLCLFFGVACALACCGSPASLAFIGLNRYVCVCHNKYYSAMFSRKGTLIVFSFLWLYTAVPVIAILLGLGEVVYDKKALLCTASRLYSPEFATFVVVTDMLIPICVVIILYSLIFHSVHQSKKSLQKLSKEDKTMKKAHVKQEMRLARTLLAVLLTMLICVTPWAILRSPLVDMENKYPRAVYSITVMLYHMNSTLNPVLYGITNPRFRHGYIVFLRKLCPCIPKSIQDKMASSSVYGSDAYRKQSQTSAPVSEVETVA